MPSDRLHLCIFGDSHFACLKQAMKDGLVSAPDMEIEFWGNVGHRFRRIGWRNGRIEGLDDFTTYRFAKFNERDRTHLSARDFDAILFAGCRIPIQTVFDDLLARRIDRPVLSGGVERRIIADHLSNRMPYVFARRMAAQNAARILVAPISFDIDPQPDAGHPDSPAMANARAAIWSRFGEVMSAEGITLVPQPEETVARAALSDARFATDDHVRRNDFTHKNAAYGAILLDRVFDRLRAMTGAATPLRRRGTG